MKMRQKQLAAALAAVEQYLEEEQAALAAQAAPGVQSLPAEPGAWALAGRMEAMGIRRLMQMRAIARLR